MRYTIKRNSADPTQVDKFKCRLTSVLRDVPIESFSLTISTVTLAVCQNISMIDNHEEILVDTVAAFIQQLYPCGPNDTELNLTFDDRMQDLTDILQYLFQTQDKGLILDKVAPFSELKLTCYVDASWLSHSDSKSQTGYCLSFGNTGAF